MIKDVLSNDWDLLLKSERRKPYYKNLLSFMNDEYDTKTVFPPKSQIFAALKATPYKDVKVVIVGQDPYHEKNQSNGLCFSVNEGVTMPPSLRNIYKELKNEYGGCPNTTDLTYLAVQGVLLLNTVLTVVEGHPRSHQDLGWEIFTNSIIELINEKNSTIVFLLWGNDAKTKIKSITNPLHVVLTAAHPSPLSASRGFFGCNHFTLANEALINAGKEGIKWY